VLAVEAGDGAGDTGTDVTTVRSLSDDRCTFEPGSDHPELLALYLGMLDADFTVVDSPELVEALRKLARRYQRAVRASGPAPSAVR